MCARAKKQDKRLYTRLSLDHWSGPFIAYYKSFSGMSSPPNKSSTYSFVLPVLFYEYLAISLTRSLVPSMMVGAFGVWTYAVVGVVEAIRGAFAFIACPLFGKLSDRVGRKFCLLASVIGVDINDCIL